MGLNYIGTVDDIDDNNYNNNADTFFGNYGKLIAQVMEHAPNARFCLIKIPLKETYTAQYNEAIEGLANHFGIPFIDPYDDNFFDSALYKTKSGGHPTCAGYVGMALAYERLFSKCVENNIDYFMYAVIN